MRRPTVALWLAIALIAGVALVAIASHSSHPAAAAIVPLPETTSTTPPTDPPTTPAPTTTVPAAPSCPAPPNPIPATSQLAAQTSAALGYSNAPGGPIVGRLPVNRWGGPTVRPVISQQGSSVQVGRETRPNGSTAWVAQQDVTMTTTPYWIVISICQRSLTLYQSGQPVYTSPVGVGQPQWPTPLGPSYVDAIVATPKSQLGVYGPTVLITGSHSNVFTEFDGGDGTVAIHGYPSAPGTTNGVASSHGCVRVSARTIDAVKVVPVGTPITIIA